MSNLNPAQFGYRGRHQPTPEYGAPAHDLTQLVGEDIYTHPHYYASETGWKESVRQLQAVRNKPEAPVHVYRAVPPGVAHINPGDWVSPSRSYAKQHAESQGGHYDREGEWQDDHWPVLHAQVPAGHLHWPGDSVNEFGYFGPEPVRGD